MQILLASSSKRRLELLSAVGHQVLVIPADVVEVSEHEGQASKEVALVNAKLKARHVFLKHGLKGSDVLLGADTVVMLKQKLFGKAENAKEAHSMLKELSGQTHVVATGYCLINKNGQELCGIVETEVRFRELLDHEIASYVATNDWHDKAGAYGVQTLGASLVNKVMGSITNVIGLPVHEVLKDARKLAS